MAFVITEGCLKDELCAGVCPTDCVHPKKDEPNFEAVDQLFINPAECIDCGACVPVCPSNSIYAVDELPEELKAFAERNANFYAS
ncbi:MAG TPA: 4Fe-4S binding protein [Terriglobales bacterium]|nr:4Fe-4S binding protein [Terriglobales bacterium]